MNPPEELVGDCLPLRERRDLYDDDTAKTKSPAVSLYFELRGDHKRIVSPVADPY